MEGLSVDDDRVDAAAIKSPENGGSSLNQQLDLHHRRSKSASEREPDDSRLGASACVRSNRREIHMSPLSSKAYGVRTRLHDYPSSVRKTCSTNQRSSLEKDIEELQLRLQQEKCMRMTLEKAMGRASSTLSPGHRHFAVRSQMKELITEIELLEEEVTNREQHVLSLYRNIFEQCVSQAPSEQNSVLASPAHTKQVPRRHPSIISSAFCSSKTFPLRSLRSLVALNNLGKGISRTPDAQFSIHESDISFEKTSPNHVKDLEKPQATEKTSVLRTLKDHLYQCPVKLSEDMVRCMAAVYCWLRNASSAASGKSGKSRSPILSRSSTNVIPPPRSIREDREWSCKSMVEISCISTEKSRFSQASYAINSYRALVEQLERVTSSQMEKDSRIAFWINVYNAMVMHAYLAYGVPHSSLKRLALFHKAAYNIGGHIISANVIEHSILCFHTPRVGKWLETFLSTALRKKSSVEDRQLIASKFGLSSPQPLVCFALCTGAVSDPVLKVYTASHVKHELDQAKTEFLQSNVMIKKSRRVFLPKILERFAKEASIPSDNLLNWVSENVDKKLNDSIQKCIHRKSNKKASQLVEWLPYNSRFRYVFSKDLTEKPWMV